MNSPRQDLAVFSCSIFSGKEARRPVRRAGRGEDHKSRGAPASADPGRLDPGGVAMRVFAGLILAALRRRCCGRESLIGMQIGISRELTVTRPRDMADYLKKSVAAVTTRK